jgi:DNA-directed RNA polymerase specialized sigma24 family protein
MKRNGPRQNRLGSHSPTLLGQLAQENDVESWNEFYRLYGRVVRDFSIQAGLARAEADVVQETDVTMARYLPEYRYDPKVCRFETWLLNQARWRINDQLRKRSPEAIAQSRSASSLNFPPNDDTAKTATIIRVPDPAAADLDFQQSNNGNGVGLLSDVPMGHL